MNMRHRPLATAALLVALAGCVSDPATTQETAVTETPDTATPDTATPDTATPDTATPDTATPDTATPDTATPDTVAPETTTPETTTTGTSMGALAVADLAGRLSIDENAVEIVGIDEVDWRDGSVGCPKKDFQYTQVITPGVRIRLAVDGRPYEYHAAGGRDPFYCAEPQPPVGE